MGELYSRRKSKTGFGGYDPELNPSRARCIPEEIVNFTLVVAPLTQLCSPNRQKLWISDVPIE